MRVIVIGDAEAGGPGGMWASAWSSTQLRCSAGSVGMPTTAPVRLWPGWVAIPRPGSVAAPRLDHRDVRGWREGMGEHRIVYQGLVVQPR